MRDDFNRQLAALNGALKEMGEMIQRVIANATQALTDQDAEAAKTVIAADSDIDHMEREIESMCLKLLLRQQPVAKDLRLISAALKMITDMERIGDQAADISELVVYISGKPFPKGQMHLPQMGENAIKMVRLSIEAFVNRDLELARNVMTMDDSIDELFDTVKNEIIEQIRTGAADGSQALDLLMIAKYYERIGDHAQNIAEWVEYALTGKHKGVYLT